MGVLHGSVYVESCEKPCQSLVRKEPELWLASAGNVERKRDTVQVLDSRRKCEGIFFFFFCIKVGFYFFIFFWGTTFFFFFYF